MFPEFIKTAYCVLVPLLLLLSLTTHGYPNRLCWNLLATINILLIIHSFFLVWQLKSIYELTKAFGMHSGSFLADNYGLFTRLLLIILLPLLSLLRWFRINRWYSLSLLILLFWVFPVPTWNLFDLPIKIAAFGCLWCAAYALFWLLNLLPYQSPPR
ncbi:MAG: hypothetical protein JO301_14025 [Chitinophagaceae bacterium]|nr:hypothetical protein [Chitinophagaceae bacterium]